MITKAEAYKSLGQKIRKQYGMTFDESYIITEEVLTSLKGSSESGIYNFSLLHSDGVPEPGGHPDYTYLAEKGNVGKVELGGITAFYLDLKNFTKYCKFLPHDNVYKAKAATIEAVIGICRIYGGHLHEIPGDGVLVFFGGKNANLLESSNHAIQAACDSMSFLENEIIPEYNNDEDYPNIFPKMGVDFGDSLWGAYGSFPHFEVKATSFYVDIASKMMIDCNSRQIKIGDSIKEQLEIKEDFLEAGWTYKKEYNKEAFQYKTWFFDWQKFKTENMSDDIELAALGLLDSQKDFATPKVKLSEAPLA